jgi:hypothetical protein
MGIKNEKQYGDMMTAFQDDRDENGHDHQYNYDNNDDDLHLDKFVYDEKDDDEPPIQIV